jgi:hypothetical protein
MSAKPLNDNWMHASRGRRITIARTPLVGSATRIFTIGSCFAMEIRRQLQAGGYRSLPDFGDVRIDRARQFAGGIPDNERFVYYDTFTIRQEFDKAFGLWTQGADSYWRMTDRPINASNKWPVVFQDPHRKLCFADSHEGIEDLRRQVDKAIAAGIHEADVYVITLGLIETWRIKATGRFCCRPAGTAGAGGLQEAEFHLSSFEENLANMQHVFRTLFQHYPRRQVVLTVSPVALEATFTGGDVVVANTESKALLRAVAGRLCREFPNVHYFPSYEYALYGDVFEEDGRHVKRKEVANILDFFFSAFGEDGVKAAAPAARLASLPEPTLTKARSWS